MKKVFVFWVQQCFTLLQVCFMQPPPPNSEPLSVRLSTDKDYQNFVLTTYNVLQKVKSTHSVALFKKVSAKRATNEEYLQLVKQLNFGTIAEFNDYISKSYKSKLAAVEKFPELKNETAKDEVYQAAKQILKLHTDMDCALMFMSIFSFCSSSCYFVNDYSSCWWYCVGGAMADWSLCSLLAD